MTSFCSSCLKDLKVEESLNNNRILLLSQDFVISRSISFYIAYEHASSGGYPLIISNKSLTLNNLPVFVDMSTNKTDISDINNNKPYTPYSWAPAVLDRIGIKYTKDANELKLLMASIHAFKPHIPTLLIIDSLSSYLDPDSSLGRSDTILYERCFQTLHFIDDAVSYIDSLSPHNNSIDSTSSPLRLCITDTSTNKAYLKLLSAITYRHTLHLEPDPTPQHVHTATLTDREYILKRTGRDITAREDSEATVCATMIYIPTNNTLRIEMMS